MPYKVHPEPEKVQAYRTFGIYANYDDEAPDTRFFCHVPNRELAEEVCEFLNRSPQSFPIAFVDGAEFHKSFRFTESLVDSTSDISFTFGAAIENFVDSIDLTLEVRSESGTRGIVVYGGEPVFLLPSETKLGRILYDPERDMIFNEAGELLETKRVSVEHLAPGDKFSITINGENLSSYEFRSIRAR